MTGKDGAASFTRPLRTIFDVGAVAGLTDGELLERFAARRGESAELAFAALLERHGPMVFRVCRKVLGDRHDALDAFQATFLVLVRRAGSVRKADSIASWLHGVAYRVAMADRVAEARRRKHERLAVEASGRDRGQEPPDDLGPLLHRELDRLPERYRAPLVLCHLEGLTHEQAADRLGWPVGTVKSRMARGRDRLKARLTGRGVDSSACFAMARISNPPPTVMDATARAATILAAGRPIAGTVPASAIALMQGVLNAMTLKKIKLTAAGLLATGIVATAAGVLAQQPEPRPAPAPVVGTDIRYETKFIEMTGLGWRADFHERLTTLDRKGPYTVWSVDAATLREILGRGQVVAAPKVIAFADARANIIHETKTTFLAGFKEQGSALPGVQIGAGVAEVDNVVLTSDGKVTIKATEARFGKDSRGGRPIRAADVQEIPDGVRVEFSGHPAEGGVLVRAELESSRIVSLVTNPISEAIAVGGGVLDGKIEVQVPEVVQSQFRGEWLVPADQFLIVGLGIHRPSSTPAQSEVRERLVAFRVDQVASTIPQPEKATDPR